ncbi:MAG: hypothetical protein ACI4QD_02880 [Kiritimatiellia bacterium]
MTIWYQGHQTQTSAGTVGAFLRERNLPETAIAEYKGEVYCGREQLDRLVLEEGADLNLFDIVSGG